MYSSINVSYGWPTSPAERPTSTLSWINVLPSCISISQPEPGWPRYFARCAEAADDAELREIHRDLVEMARMAEIVRPVVRVVHRGVDPHGDAELRRLRVERVVAPVARRNAVDERRDAERLEALFANQPLELADARHALEGVDADARQPDEAIGIASQERRLLVVGDTEGHGAHDPELAELVDVGVEAHVRAVVGAFATRAEDAAVVRHAVPGRLSRGRL